MLCGAFHDTAKNLPQHCQHIPGAKWCGLTDGESVEIALKGLNVEGIRIAKVRTLLADIQVRSLHGVPLAEPINPRPGPIIPWSGLSARRYLIHNSSTLQSQVQLLALVDSDDLII